MRLVIAFLCTFLFGQLSFAQTKSTPYSVPESDARQHLLEQQEPLYPPIAKAARVQGDVGITLVIDIDGHVVSEEIMSGPPMLRQAALDAVKKWRFKPFQVDGATTAVTTTLTIPFHLDTQESNPTAEQEKAAQAWFPLSEKCSSAIQKQNVQDALDICKEALDLSFKAGDLNSSEQLGRMDSHQLYGRALLAAGKVQEALEQENLAIQEARKCLKETDQEYAMPFFWRAVAEVHLGQMDAAFTDLTVAEETLRKAILYLPDMKDRYSKYLVSILKQHAALLDQVGRSTDAARLRAEAASL
jgi:TonB family protein